MKLFDGSFKWPIWKWDRQTGRCIPFLDILRMLGRQVSEAINYRRVGPANFLNRAFRPMNVRRIFNSDTLLFDPCHHATIQTHTAHCAAAIAGWLEKGR